MGSCRYFTQRAWERPVGMTGDVKKCGAEEDGNKAGGKGVVEKLHDSDGDRKHVK
jgi:hypothetical protein